MNYSQNLFENNVKSILEKDFYFTKHEISILLAIISVLVGSKNFSISEVSRRFGRNVGSNSCTQILKKLLFVQEKITKRFLDDNLVER